MTEEEPKKNHGDMGVEMGCPQCGIRVLIDPDGETLAGLACPTHGDQLVVTGVKKCLGDDDKGKGDGWYMLDTPWGCGSIQVERGRVVPGGAPIFKKLWGAELDKLSRIYKTKQLFVLPEDNNDNKKGT